MIEEKYDIQELLDNPKSSVYLQKARESSKWHTLHSNGDGYYSWWLKRNIYLESERNYNIKKEICSPETPRIIEGIKKQYFKIFRAKGRAFSYNGLDKNQKADFELALSKIAEGMSLNAFMEKKWHEGMFEDPNAVIGLELKPEDELTNGVPEPCAVIYPSSKIYDICIKNNEVEYIIFNTCVIKDGEEKDAKRVIDEEYDTVYIKEGEVWVINTRPDGTEDRIENSFKKVPFRQLSETGNSAFDDFMKTSPITKVLPDLRKYLSIADDHFLCVKLHQHPLFYSYPVICPTCNGAKEIKNVRMNAPDAFINEGQDMSVLEAGECPACHGVGVVAHWKSDTTQGISLAIADKWEEEGYPAAAAPAGYVDNDNETLKEQRVEKEEIEKAIEKGALGVVGILETNTSRETATRAELNLQPLIDSLSNYANNAEKIQTFLTDLIGEILYSANWKGCSIFLGRKYFLRSEDNIMKELEQAKKSGAPISYIIELQEELVYIRFEKNGEALERALIINEIEPFNGYTIDEINNFLVVNKYDYIIKTNFADFIERFQEENGDLIDFIKKKEDYKKQLKEVKLKFKEYAKEQSEDNIASNGGGGNTPSNATGNQGS